MDLAKFSKAIAAAIAGFIVVWLTKHNIVIADQLPDAIEILIGAFLTGVITWLAPKNRTSK